jgi:Tfp pilus assembly protein PilF
MKGKEEDAKKMIDAALELDKKDLVANFCNAYLALREKNVDNSAHALRKTSYVTKQLAE